jgi:hypothetical protein
MNPSINPSFFFLFMEQLLSPGEARFLRFAEDYADHWEKFLGLPFCNGHYCCLSKFQSSLSCSTCGDRSSGTYLVGELRYCLGCWREKYPPTKEENLHIHSILERLWEELGQGSLDIALWNLRGLKALAFADDCIVCRTALPDTVLGWHDRDSGNTSRVHLSCLSGKTAKSAVY